jgi:hypothetical protein
LGWVVHGFMMAWLSPNPAQRDTELLFLLYSPVWMLTVAAVVFFGWYEWFTAENYMAIGLLVSLPCLLLPALFVSKTEKALSYSQRYGKPGHLRADVWQRSA